MKSPILKALILSFSFIILLSTSLSEAQTLEPIFNPSMTPIAFGPSDSALGEGIDNVIDGSKSNKFLTFEKSWGLNFYVDTEELSIVKSLTITTANDHPERDPKLIKIYGRNVPSGTNSTDTKPGWTLIDEVSFRCRDLNEARRADNTEDVDNDLAYNSYWIRLHNPCDASEANSVQISEVQLYGIFNQAPSVIFDATGTGGAEVGKEITAIYEYSDPEDDPESGTTFQWYLDNVAIEGATSVSYMPTIDDLGSELKVKITPNDGTSTGTEVLSLIGIINCSAGFTCEVQNVSICDSNTYQVPGGDLVSTTGTYEVTEGTVKTYYNVSFDRSDVTSDVYTNGLIAESGLVTYTANTQATGILTFDKSQDYWVNMNALQDDLDGTNRSVFMWVKSEADVVSDDQTLFAINTASGGNVALFKIDNDGENLELFDGSDNQSASFDMGDEQWHYVGYTYDAATTETVIYVDGIENDRFKDNQSTVNDSQYSLGQEFDNANDSDHMNGDMAEISIWNEVLTGAEIREAMQAKINNGHPKYANLVGYYSVFGDCDDDTAVLKDHSGKGNDGVMVNGLTVDFQNVQSIPGFNAIDWYEHISWKKDGAEVSTDPTYTFDVAAGSYELVATRNFVQSTDSWTMTLNSNATTVDIIADETLCADDPITRTVSTSTVNYLDFEETEGNFIEVNPVVNDIAGKSYSVFMWLNKESNIGTDDFNEVLVFQDSDVDNLSRFYFRDTERLALWDGTNDRLNSSVLSNDTWYFVGYTYDNATGETKLYLNGNVEDSGTLDMPLGEGWMATLGAKYNDNGLEDHLDGKMAEITIWDKVLTQEEVTSLMGSAPVHDAANLVAAYGTHKNIADNQLRDLTANGNNGLASHQTIIINNLEEVIPGYDASAHYTFSWKKGGIEFDTDAIGNITVEEGTIAYSVTYGTPLFQKSDDFSLSYTNLLPTQPVSKTAGALGSVTFEVDEIAGASYQWYERKEGLQVDTRISSAVTDIKESENFVYYQGSSSLFIENKDDGNIQTFSFPSITGVLEHDGYIYVTSKTHGLYVSSIGNIIFDNITEEDGLISDTGTGILVTSTGVVVMIHGDDPDEGIQHTHISQINYDQNSYPDLRVGRASYNSIVEFKNKVYVIDSDLFDEYKVNNNNTDFVMKFPEDINQAGRSLLVEKITSNSNVVVGYTHNNTVFITSDIENASNYTQLTVPISYRRGIQDIHLTSDRLYVATSGDGIFELDLNNIAEGLIQNQDYDLTTTAVGVVGGNIEVGLSTGIQSFEDRTTLSNNSDNTAINQIQGATTHQLTINNLSLDENAAEYFVEVTLGECTQPSDNVTLSVLDVPAVLSQSPSNESTDVAIDTQLSIEFSKTVSKGSGELKIYNYSTDALVQTFTADDLTIDGTTVSVASGVSLGYATQYYITLGADLVKDESDAGNLALTNKDTWSFHTVCEPLIITEPEDQSGLVGGSATFSVPEVAGASYQWFNKNDRTDELLNNIGSIASVSATSSGIFVGAATGLYRSTDNGESFSQLNDSTNINVVFEKNGTLYVGYESGLGISTDNGETFSIKTTTNSDLPSNDIANISVFDNTLYLSISDASSNGGVIVSTDNGESFERKTLSDGLGSNEVYDVFGAGDNIYVATKSGLSISTNGGESFENKTTANGLKTNTVRHVVVSSNGTIYAGTTAGMSISTDGGVTFIDMPTNGELASSVVRDLEIKNDLAYIAVRSTSGGAGIYTTTDGGQTLNTIFEEGFGGYRSVVISVLNGKVYAGGVGSILLSHSSTSPLVSGIDAAANNYIIGAASASLTINNLTEDVDQTQYFVVVTKGECEETSNVAALTVTEGLGSISYTSLSPSNEATAVSLTPTVSLTLSEAVQKGTGTIELRKSSDDQLVTSLEANSDQVAITDNTVTLGLGDLSLDYGTSYYLIIPNTAFTDGNGKQFVGIDDKNTWSFITTCDGLISSELIDKTAALGESVTFTINEIPGATYQWKKSFSGIFGNLSDEAGKIQGATTNSLTISNLEASDNGSRYLLLVTAENCSENSNVAVINLEQSAELLEIKSLNPADGSSDLEAESLNTTIPNSNKFWITFSEGVKYGNTSAEYKLYTSADDQLVASQTLLSTLAGPPVGNTTAGFGFYNYTFEPGTSYYILMDAGMYKSVANDEEFPGITDKTTWSFTTKVSDVEPLEVTSTFPSATRDALLDFPYLNIEFAEQIALGTGEVTIYRASDNSVFETLDISTGRVKNSGSPLQVQLALSQNWEEGVSYYIQYPKGLITSLDGSKELQAINDKTSLAFKAESFNENIITNFFPATGSSTYVADSEDDLVIYTSVGVALERDPLGSFRIYKAANDELVKTIEYDGENERDLDYGDDEGYIKFEFDDDELEPGTEYYVLVDDGFIISYEEGLYHVGISDPTTWRFTTLEEPTTPKFVSSNPASGATDVAISANIELTYSENIQAYVYGEARNTTNNIVLYDANDNEIESFPANSDRLSYSGSKVTINPTNNLNYNTTYYVLIDDEAFVSNNEVESEGVLDPTTISFTTAGQPNTAPLASNVAFTGNLEANQELSGSYDYSDVDTDAESGSTIQWFMADDATGANRTAISGATSSTFTLTSAEVGKFITFGVTPNDGTDAGTRVLATYDGPVVAAVVPTLVSTSPADGALDVLKDANLSLTLSEAITAGTGNITLSPVNGAATVIDVTSAEVTILGTDVTINPASDLLDGEFYTVTFDAAAFVDADGNNSAGLTSQTTWNFTVKEANVAPEAQGVSIKQSIVVSEMLEGSYTFFDQNDDTESGTTYQWYRADDVTGTGRTAIAGATAQNYTVVNDDNNKFISFEVTPNDGSLAGAAEESTFFGPVLINDGITNIPPAFTSDALTSVLDNAAYSYTVTYEDLNNDVPTLTKTTGPDWLSVNGFVLSGNPTSANIGNHSIVLTLDDGNGGTKTQEFTVNVLQSNTAPSVNGVEITGTTTIDEVLTATYNFIDAESDADNSSFKWYRSDDSSGTGKTAISGATTTSYTLVAADAGKFISFEVTPNDGTVDGTIKESILLGSVAKKIPTLSLSDIAKTYGDADFDLSATTNSSGTISYTFNNDQTGAGINGATVTLGNVGEITVNVSLAEDAEYAARQVQGTITVAKKAIALKATDAGKVVDDTDPTLEFTVTSGAIIGEDEVVTVSRDAGEAPGIYAINLIDGADAANYEIAAVPGVFTISQRNLTITAQAAIKTYGDADPTFNYSITEGALENGDELSGGITRVEGEDVGTYALQGSLYNPEYKITFVSADLTIGKATLTATADDKSKAYGEENPELTISYSGFVNGDTKADITEPTAATVANASSPIGTYDIALSGGAATNYNINLVNGQLTVEQRPFITTWEITSNDVNRSRTFFNTLGSHTYLYDIDWGDGAVETDQTGAASHTYVAEGTYTVKISGQFPQFELPFSRLRSVEQWGDIEWKSMEGAFVAAEFDINATDAPKLSQVTSMKRMFERTFIGNPDLTSWDVANITDMSEMFKESDFNGDISGWDVSAVTDMSYMFAQAENFNSSISNWNTSAVQNMSYMFYYAQSFNQSIDAWDVSSVALMSSMFADAAMFNQDLNSWDVSSVTKMDKMFDNALLFNGDITGWNVSGVTDMSNMFDDAKHSIRTSMAGM
ncbi:BspA family leucine-rich repeat surface protein [Roseivirga seohaensis]|uniref:BspA family leucine-rich repeat surface protein n=1 Tax=Roseivirga seohaensis TaxID=1914963 RepID=UPI003BA8AC8D